MPTYFISKDFCLNNHKNPRRMSSSFEINSYLLTYISRFDQCETSVNVTPIPLLFEMRWKLPVINFRKRWNLLLDMFYLKSRHSAFAFRDLYILKDFIENHYSDVINFLCQLLKIIHNHTPFNIRILKPDLI